MSKALTSLPWVDSDTIKIDAKKRQAKFTLRAGTKFDMGELKQALGDRYSGGAKLLAGPTEQ